jgi:hypothetical protein
MSTLGVVPTIYAAEAEAPPGLQRCSSGICASAAGDAVPDTWPVWCQSLLQPGLQLPELASQWWMVTIVAGRRVGRQSAELCMPVYLWVAVQAAARTLRQVGRHCLQQHQRQALARRGKVPCTWMGTCAASGSSAAGTSTVLRWPKGGACGECIYLLSAGCRSTLPPGSVNQRQWWRSSTSAGPPALLPCSERVRLSSSPASDTAPSGPGPSDGNSCSERVS